MSLEDKEKSRTISPLYYTGQWMGSVLRWMFLICIAFIILYPLLYMVSISLRSADDFLDVTVVWLPKTLTFSNFKTAILEIDMLDAMKNTAIISGVSSILQVFIACLTGYGFARFKFRGNGLLFMVVIFSLVVPPQMLSMPNSLLFKNFDFFGLYHLITGTPSSINLSGGFLTYFLPALFGQGLRSGVFILIFRQFFTGLPKELEEAAFIDGCGYGRTFTKVMLPNAIMPMVLCMLFSTVWYWGDCYLAYVNLTNTRVLATLLTGMRAMLESVLTRDEFASAYSLIPIEQAACLFSILPLILVFIVGQKFFVQGIDKTGLVG